MYVLAFLINVALSYQCLFIFSSFVSLFKLIAYQVSLRWFFKLNILGYMIMLSWSIFIAIVIYFPVFNHFNFIFEIKILYLLLRGDKIFMIFSEILVVNNFIRCQFLKWISVSIIVSISFYLEFKVFKNVNIIFWIFSAFWLVPNDQTFLNLSYHF